MSSYKYKDLMVWEEKEETKPYLLTQVDTTYGGNGLAPVYTQPVNNAAAGSGVNPFNVQPLFPWEVEEKSHPLMPPDPTVLAPYIGNSGGVGGAAVGGNASDVVDDTYAGNGAISDVGVAVGGGTPDETPPKTQNGGGDAVQPVDSYASFAKYFEQMRQNSIASATAARANAYRNAEQATERAMVDAQNSYRQNLSGYGARGEALLGAGLAGSGYADYLDSKAYATMRGEVQAARAQEFSAKQNADYMEKQATLDADNSYAANMLELEKAKKTDKTQKLSAYQTMLGNAHSGVYATVDAAKDAAATAGLDEPQTAAIVNATQKYIDRLQYANNEEVALALGDYIGVIQNKVLGGKLSEEQGQSQIYNILSENFEAAIANGAEFDASEVEALTDEAWKDKFVKLYNERYETSDKLFLKSEGGYTIEGEYVTEAEAESILAKALGDELLDEPAKKAIQKSFDYRYGAQSASDFVVRGIQNEKDNVRIVNSDESIKFIAEKSDTPAGDWLLGIAKKLNVGKNGVFVYGQYAYTLDAEGKVYGLIPGKRESQKESYEKFIKHIKDQNGLTGG